MSRTLTALLALLVLLAVGAAWLLLDGGAAGQAEWGAAHSESSANQPLPESTTPAGTDVARVQSLELSGVAAELAAVEALREELSVLRSDSWVTGRLVDPEGLPLTNEPLLLVLDQDPWWRPSSSFSKPALPAGPPPVPVGEPLSSTTSDADGRFQLAARTGARHRLRAGGRATAPRLLEDVRAGAELLLVLQAGVTLRGQVLAEETGEPVKGAHVGVLSSAQHLITQCDSSGRFELAPLRDDEQLYGAWAPGFGMLTGSLVPSDEDLVFELPAARDVTGQVLESATNLPVEGARVQLLIDIEARLAGVEKIDHELHVVHEVEVFTDVEGRFVFFESPARGFSIEASAEGFLPTHTNRFENRALHEDENIVLSLKPVEPFVARVFDAESGAPLADVSVELRAKQSVLSSTLSDTEGLAELDPSSWDGHGSAYFFARDERGFTAQAARSRSGGDVRLELVEPAVLQVLTTLNGAPLPHAEVAVRSYTTPTIARSNAEGLVELHHERSGPNDSLRVQARHAGLQSVLTDIEWPFVAESPLEIALDAGSFLNGLVFDENGSPVVAARVWSNRTGSDYTDSEGHFALGPAVDDDFGKLFAEAEGYKRASQSDVWASSQDLVLTLEPELRLSGRVVQADTFLPVEQFGGRLQRERLAQGAWIWEDLSARLRPDRREPGSFSVALGEPGRYRVRVTHDESLTAYSVPVDFDGRLEPPELEVQLSPGAILVLQVEDSRGVPVQGLRVVVLDKAQVDTKKRRKNAKSWSKRSNSEGLVEFRLSEGGQFVIRMPENEKELGPAFFVWPGPPVERKLVLGATGDLLVDVRDEAGLAVPSMRVRVRSVAGSKLSRSEKRRTAEGEVLLEALLPGSYLLSVEARGFVTHQRKVTVLGGLTQSVDVVLSTGSASRTGGARRGARRTR